MPDGKSFCHPSTHPCPGRAPTRGMSFAAMRLYGSTGPPPTPDPDLCVRLTLTRPPAHEPVGAPPLRAGCLSIGSTCVTAARHLPGALPVGARHSNSTPRCHAMSPVFVDLEILYPAPRRMREDGTPHKALSSVCCSLGLPDTRGGQSVFPHPQAPWAPVRRVREIPSRSVPRALRHSAAIHAVSCYSEG